MEQLKTQLLEWWSVAKTWLMALEPFEWAIGGGTLLLLLILVIARRSYGKRNRRMAALPSPALEIHAFQVAPLGRDAFLKIRNTGEPATLSNMVIKGRNDIVVKNNVAGHQLARDKVYSILLETNSNQRINSGFTIDLTYLDQHGRVYQQSFSLG